MRLVFKSTFFKYITILAAGSGIAQIITLATAPLITRLYTPEDIGVYTYILAISQLFMSVINGRYDMSIVNEKNGKYILPLIKLSLIIAFIMSILISIIYGIYIYISSKENLSNFYTIIFLFVLLFSYGIINVLTSFNNRNKEYKLLSSVYVIRTSCQNFGAIILGIMKMGMMGLLTPYTFGQLLGIRRQAKSLKPYFKDIRNVTRKEMKEVMRLHYKQPLYSAPAQFANSFSYSAITIFLESLFSIGVVGFYSMSVRLLGLPLSIISGSVSKVFFEEASREFDSTGKFYKSFKKTALFQVALAVPMVLCMIFLTPKLFSIIFGESWKVAGEYVSILAPMFGIRFIVTSLSPGLLVAKKQTYDLMLQILFIVASFFCFIITKHFSLSVEIFLSMISISYSVVYVIFLIIILRISKG